VFTEGVPKLNSLCCIVYSVSREGGGVEYSVSILYYTSEPMNMNAKSGYYILTHDIQINISICELTSIFVMRL